MNQENKKINKNIFNALFPIPKLAKNSQKKMMITYIADFINIICTVLLCIQILAVFYMVIARYILKASVTGMDELSLLCMVWYSLLTFGLGIINGNHIRIEVTDIVFGKKISKRLDIFWLIVLTILGIVMTICGIQITKFSGKAFMPSLGISKSWLYVAVPASGILLAIACVDKIRRSVHGN